MESQSSPVQSSASNLSAEFADLFGGSLIVVMIMLPIFGSSLLQTYVYFLNYGDDSRFLKGLVISVITLGALHASFACHQIYYYLVESYLKPGNLLDGVWTLYSNGPVAAVIVVMIQVFFIRMVYRLTKGYIRIVLTTLLSLLSLAQLGIAIRICIATFTSWELDKLSGLVSSAYVPLLVMRVCTDTIIAAVLCLTLFEARSNFSGSIKLVRTLIVYSMNRFILNSTFVIAQTIALIKHRNSLSIIEMEFVWVNLYIASFLATLNSRNHLRAIGGGETEYGIRNSTSSRKQSSVNPQAIRLNSVRGFTAPRSHDSSKVDVEFGASSIDGLPTLDLSPRVKDKV